MASDMDNSLNYKCKVCGKPIGMFDYKYRDGMCNSCIIDETKRKQSEAIRNALTTRKETAKAILNVLYFNLQNSVKGNLANSNDYYNVISRIQEIAKNYGVEIEEWDKLI